MLQLTKIILYLKAEKHYKTIFRPIEANVFLNLEIGNTFFYPSVPYRSPLHFFFPNHHLALFKGERGP